MTLFERVVVPVATREDADETVAALEPYIEEVDTVVAVHVIEKAGGAPDKAPLGKRESDAGEILGDIEELLEADVTVETRLEYGTGVVEALFEAADDAGATAVAFRPREEGRIVRLLSGDTSRLSAIVDARPGMSGYPALVARELDVPMISGAPMPANVAGGTVVTVHGERGVVYEGDVVQDRQEELPEP